MSKLGVLPDQMIRELVEKKELKIDPFDLRCLAPASYDMRVGDKALKSAREEGGPVVDLSREKVMTIGTGEFVEVLTLERLELPADIAGRFGIRSFYTRKGLLSFAGPQVDPGFRGYLNISLFNSGPRPIVLKHGDSFCTIEFSRLEKPSEKPYEGQYQDQKDFPSDNIEFILGAKGVTLYEVVETMKALRGDVKWMKWLLVAIFGALLAAILTRLI